MRAGTYGEPSAQAVSVSLGCRYLWLKIDRPGFYTVKYSVEKKKNHVFCAWIAAHAGLNSPGPLHRKPHLPARVLVGINGPIHGGPWG